MPTIQPALDESCVRPARSIKMFYEEKNGRQRERVICQSHKLIRGRTKVRHTLAAFSASGKNASFGDCKMGACLGKGHGTPTPRGAKQSRQKPLLVYSADRKSFFSQGTFFTKKLGVVPGQGQGIIFIIS